jgi:spore germination cell wall hydrolase CwlJ-like protein
MIKIVRAAGKAAAALVLAITATAAQPAFASEADAASTGLVLETTTRGSLDLDLDSILAQPATTGAAPAVIATLPAPGTAPAAQAQPAVRRSLADLVSAHSGTQARDAQADCLAAAVYHESKGEPLAGQLAVAEVIINRARSGRFATTLCGVITQRSQFSFVRGGRIPTPPRDASWRNAVAIAHIALDDLADSPVADALFFHARYVSPNWRNVRRLSAVGNHIFYR